MAAKNKQGAKRQLTVTAKGNKESLNLDKGNEVPTLGVKTAGISDLDTRN